MRALFLFLLAANLAYYAWTVHRPPPLGRDPAPLARQIAPERLRILDDEAQPAQAPRAPAPCLEWGPFSPAEVARAEESLASRLGAAAERRQEELPSWWVYIPAQGGRAGAQRKIAEVRARGISDVHVVQEEGPERWAISLGVYTSEQGARRRLAELLERGVRSARLAERASPVARVWLRFVPQDEEALARAQVLADAVPGSTLQPCAAAAPG